MAGLCSGGNESPGSLKANFYLSGALKDTVYATKPQTLEELRVQIEHTCNDIPLATIHLNEPRQRSGPGGGTCGETTTEKMDPCSHDVGPYVGKRGQGRPRLRWSDMFTREAGKQWSRTAKNRVLWKELGKKTFILRCERESGVRKATGSYRIYLSQEKLQTWRSEEKRIEAFEMWIWRRMERVRWRDRIRNEAVLERVSEEIMMLKLISKMKRNWLSHLMRRNCLLKDALEGIVNGRGFRGGRRHQMIDDIKIYGSYEETKRKAEKRKDRRKLDLQ
ncbi:hypothetical protein ANN_25182 [Periplaneta americana]|uniref:Uncharacterized protein n=1 Tax=Periplaneta americana TaxID=6978 RepID=A0ABQ8S0V4_PERAM|nr:hypothetical protein ANN_25182 [Periplaneta americana]